MKYRLLPNSDPRLRSISKPVKRITPQLKALAAEMNKLMVEAKAVGIAAPQVGVTKRMIIIGVPLEEVGRKTTVMINPVIKELDGTQISREGCLSCPGLYIEVARPYVVSVEYLDLQGQPQKKVVKGFPASVLCHEIDHLNGTLIDAIPSTTL